MKQEQDALYMKAFVILIYEEERGGGEKRGRGRKGEGETGEKVEQEEGRRREVVEKGREEREEFGE